MSLLDLHREKGEKASDSCIIIPKHMNNMAAILSYDCKAFVNPKLQMTVNKYGEIYTAWQLRRLDSLAAAAALGRQCYAIMTSFYLSP